MTRRSSGTPGTGQQVWPVLLLLLAAVAVPTACVLWFMNQAMRNERLAVRHELSRVYATHLAGIRDQIEADWGHRIADLEKVKAQAPAAEIFADLVSRGLCDSVILRDRVGNLLYPPRESGHPQPSEPMGDGWDQARQLEYQQADPLAAADAYGQIAKAASDVSVTAAAIQAQARCLASAGKKDAALDILIHTLAEPRYRQAADATGRLIAPAAQLRALQLIGNRADARFRAILAALSRRVADYSDPGMPRDQRMFIMHELSVLAPDYPAAPTLAAEELADAYLAAAPESPAGRGPFPLLLSEAWSLAAGQPTRPHLRPSHLKDVWQLAPAGPAIVALYRQADVLTHARSVIASRGSLSEATVELVPPTEHGLGQEPFLTLAVGDLMPEWRLNLYLEESGAVSRAARQQTTLYLWTAILVIVVIAVLALLVARYVTRQMKLTRLKNDLIATVSHELRTPLASTRALVETLLEGRYRDQQQVHEYLQLIARENARLSRLIDNFLTFSRMERNKRTFERTPVCMGQIVEAAAQIMSERFAAPNCRLEVRVEPNLPTITGDRDALTTVVLNLLDNAYKYTGDNKCITLRARAQNRHVYVEVEDNGIGISRRAQKRIFDRFYQVDQSLSRQAGGCGLGLSIVRFIVEAHRGTVAVGSGVGQGSVFTIALPIQEG
jgi:signal transduction histidine kinase